MQDNLAEDMSRRLTYNARRGAVDASAKPNKAEKERLDKIINSVGGHNLTVQELDLLHRFRYALTENRKGLIKFLYSVNWEDEVEVG